LKDNVVLDKSFAFAVRTVNAYKFLVDEKREFVLSKQFLRSGTSIGANAEEAVGGQSTPDFIAKLVIAYKEARETKYWIRLLHAGGYLDDTQTASLLSDINVPENNSQHSNNRKEKSQPDPLIYTLNF
jgi:four helix bundle protein